MLLQYATVRRKAVCNPFDVRMESRRILECVRVSAPAVCSARLRGGRRGGDPASRRVRDHGQPAGQLLQVPTEVQKGSESKDKGSKTSRIRES
jgi:hypothetical protein